MVPVRSLEERCEEGEEELPRWIINLPGKSEEDVSHFCRYRGEVQVAGVKPDGEGRIEEPQCGRHANLQYSKAIFLRIPPQSSL